MTGSYLFNYKLYYNGLMTDCVLGYCSKKGSISVSNNTFLLRDKNKNYLRVHTFSDNTGIG